MTANNVTVTPLPATRELLLKQRTMKFSRTLNDMVDEVHLALYENEDYCRYLDAVHDEDAVEGSLAADNIMAATMIRDYARGKGNGSELAGKKLATINKALGVVLRRYEIGRKERRNTVGGERVPTENGND